MAEKSSSPFLFLIQDLVFKIPSEEKVLFRIPSFQVQRNEKVLVIGPSGGGKSSFLNLINGLLPLHLGEIKREGSLACVYQDLNLLPDFSVLENARIELQNSIQLQRFSAHLEALSFKPSPHQLVKKLSFGERQKVSVARAIAHQSDLLIADEPTAHLDRQNADRAMRLLLEKSSAAIIVSHDLTFRSLFKKVINFEDFAV